MIRVELGEHSRIYRSSDTATDEPAASYHRDGILLKAVLYDRLQRFDELHRASDGSNKASIFDWHARYCKTKQWVGVIEVLGLQLTILPKIDAVQSKPVILPPPKSEEIEEDGSAPRLGENRAQRNLLYMLSLAGALPLKHRDVAQLATRRAPLPETLAAIFARRLQHELRVGTPHNYETFEDNIHTLRGKLVVSKQARHNAVHRERFFCRYDEFTADTLLNRIFKRACSVLIDRSNSVATRDALQSCLQILCDVSDVVIQDTQFDDMIIDRRTERFEDLLAFCRIVLCDQSPELRAGRTVTFSLLFDMNRVFERFVAAVLRKRIAPSRAELTIYCKGSGHNRHLMRSETQNILRLEPDVLVTAGGQTVLLDTKWKIYREKVANPDLYQMYAYLKRYESKRCVLLYPSLSAPAGIQNTFHLLEGSDTRAEQDLEVHTLNLTDDLWSTEGQEALEQRLSDIIHE